MCCPLQTAESEFGAESDSVLAGECPLPRAAQCRRRCLQHLRQALNKELLSAPIRLAISNDEPKVYPAWNMDFDQEQAPPRAYVRRPGKRSHQGKRASSRVARSFARRQKARSSFRPSAFPQATQAIAWSSQTPSTGKLCRPTSRPSFPSAHRIQNATYNWDVGTIQRPNATERQFEVASHRWIDLTDKSGSFGTTILTDFKNGSDKPDDNTIRLTLMRSPGIQPPANGASVRLHRPSESGLGSSRIRVWIWPATQATGARRRRIGRPTVSMILWLPFAATVAHKEPWEELSRCCT